MRKFNSFITGFLCAAFIFGGTTVLANTDVLAKITSQVFFWNNEKTELFAYNINGNNYVKLRDVAKIFGVNVAYYEDTDSVYLGEARKNETPTPAVKANIDGKAYSKCDYAADANPEIFNDIYTKDAYNAVRQSIADIEEITNNTNEKGYNEQYDYAHFIDNSFNFSCFGKTIEAVKSATAAISGYYSFAFGYEPTVSNIYEYPGYRICMPQIHNFFQPANAATDNFIAEIQDLTDKEKVKKIADLVCDKIVYRNENVGGINDVFTNSGQTNGTCATYANAFQYLCQRANIPCVTVTDDNHGWNEVYVDGKWQVTDIGYYDVGRPQTNLYISDFKRTDKDPQKTKFAKELLVPMSTK